MSNDMKMGMQILVTAITVTITVPITQWTLDRNGPYERLFGVIVPGQPEECGPDALYSKKIIPGGCVVVEWTIEFYDNHRSCQPVNSLHVSRTITDLNGVHDLPRTERYFGEGRQPFTEKLRRPFVLPEFSVPGLASYHSEACFVCNPLQKILQWQVCKTTPDVPYEVNLP